MLTRCLFDERGRARRRPMAYTIVALLVMALFGGTLAAFTPMLHGHPTLQGVWVMMCVFALKLPLVFFLWWLIVRNKEWPGTPVVWSPEETEEILAYLRGEALRALGLPDTPARLDYLSREAWHVADRADGPLKGDAVAVALEIDAMRARSRGRRPV